MNQEQKLTPKYWIVHDATTDDVFLETAHKSRDKAIQRYELFEITNGYFEDNENLKCSLFELKIVIE